MPSVSIQRYATCAPISITEALQPDHRKPRAMKAVAYYRTRPSEPEASETALRLQREAVREELERGELTLVAEFIEHEGERDPETYPAFMAAVRAAVDHSSCEDLIDVAVLVASTAAIGGDAIERAG